MEGEISDMWIQLDYSWLVHPFSFGFLNFIFGIFWGVDVGACFQYNLLEGG